MNSLIIWVLTISPYGAYCMSHFEVSFKTKAECVSAMKTVNKNDAYLTCKPREAINV